MEIASHPPSGDLKERTLRRDGLVHALLGLARSLSSSKSVTRCLEDLCRTTVDLLGCDRSSIFLLERGVYRAKVNHGNPPDIAALFPKHKVSPRDPLIVRAMESGSFVVVNDAGNSPLMNAQTVRQARIQSIVVAPIVDAQAQPLGFLTAEFNEHLGTFTDTMSTLVLGFATLAGLAVVRERQELDQQRTVAALAASEAKFRALAEQTFDGITILGEDGAIRYGTPSVARMFGGESKARLGRTFLDFVHPEDLQRCREWWTEVLRTPGRPFPTLTRVRRADGAWLWIEAMACNALEEPHVSGVVVNFRDVTERVKAEEEVHALHTELERRVAERTAQLEMANRDLETFSYSVSHDLRGPLRAIDGFGKILLDDYGGTLDERGREYLQHVRTSVRLMNELIEDLLGLARVTEGVMEVARVDLSAMGREITNRLRATQPERRIEFVIADELVADGDARLLHVALENLLGNAWKYTGRHPSARIEVGRLLGTSGPGGDMGDGAGRCAFFVRDDGAGFRPEDADKIFGLFQRSHDASEFEGTGIGLATTRRIIHRHRGRIWAEGGVEQGATFFFTLGL